MRCLSILGYDRLKILKAEEACGLANTSHSFIVFDSHQRHQAEIFRLI